MPYGAYQDPDLLDEAREVLRSSKDSHHLKRAQAVLFPIELNITLAQLAHAMNTTEISLHRWRREFLAIFEGQEDRRNSWGGERCRNLTEAEEDKLLAALEEEAEQGHILTIAPIQAAYEKKLGRPVRDSVIYRMLARHGWRKLVPRHKHKKADDAQQDEWKKKLCWRPGRAKR
jgi:transposase